MSVGSQEIVEEATWWLGYMVFDPVLSNCYVFTAHWLYSSHTTLEHSQGNMVYTEGSGRVTYYLHPRDTDNFPKNTILKKVQSFIEKRGELSWQKYGRKNLTGEFLEYRQTIYTNYSGLWNEPVEWNNTTNKRTSEKEHNKVHSMRNKRTIVKHNKKGAYREM